jgi:GNAT superfamily N-acetyltransferase
MQFLVCSLPRSRSFWLSRFLSYRDWHCGHDEIRRFRTMADVRSWLSQPCTGSAETAAAPFWRMASGMRIVTIRRPVTEVIASLARFGFDPLMTRPLLVRLNRKLDQIEHRVPGVLSVPFADLTSEETCARVFEFCLPYRHDHDWWRVHAEANLQVSLLAQARYAEANLPQIQKMAKIAKHEMLQGLRGEIERPDGVTIQEEPYDVVWRDAKALFAQHCVDIGESPDYHLGLNSNLYDTLADAGAWQIITARANGRMFGYVSAIIGPSLKGTDLPTATQLGMFVSPDARGMNLPIRMQRRAIEQYVKRGVRDVIFRSGANGAGPAMGAVYRRVGAKPIGEYYEMEIAA